MPDGKGLQWTRVHWSPFYVYPGTSCGVCDACRRGAGNLCASMQIMGFHRDGGFAEYVCAPQASLIPIPDGLPDDVAILAEPLSCCLNALERAALKAGDCVGVWGSGPAGTLIRRAAAAKGATGWTVEPHAGRRARVGGFEEAPAAISTSTRPTRCSATY